MSGVEMWAVFFGASPFGTALLLSLILTLLLLLALRLALYLGPALRGKALEYRLVREWVARVAGVRRHVQALALSLIIVFAGVAAFANLTEGLTENPLVASWDRHFVVAAHENIRQGELTVFRITTELAGRTATYVIGFGLGFYLLFTRKRRLLVLWVCGLLGNALIVQLLKQFYQRPRPELLNPFLREENFSFPSGHASASLLMYGLMAYMLLVKSPHLAPAKRLVLVCGVLWAGVFIGTSRLALGVHYPTDVLAGWLVASSLLAVLITADQFLRPRPVLPADEKGQKDEEETDLADR